MNPTEFIGLSSRIVGFGPAGARSAVSRAYYGAFHTAAILLEEVSCGCPRNGKAHNVVPQCLEFPTNADAKRAASLLSDLHSERIKVDYQLDNTSVEGREFAQVVVETANKICELLEPFRNALKNAATLADFKAHVAKVKKLHGIP